MVKISTSVVFYSRIIIPCGKTAGFFSMGGIESCVNQNGCVRREHGEQNCDSINSVFELCWKQWRHTRNDGHARKWSPCPFSTGRSWRFMVQKGVPGLSWVRLTTPSVALNFVCSDASNSRSLINAPKSLGFSFIFSLYRYSEIIWNSQMRLSGPWRDSIVLLAADCVVIKGLPLRGRELFN